MLLHDTMQIPIGNAQKRYYNIATGLVKFFYQGKDTAENPFPTIMRMEQNEMEFRFSTPALSHGIGRRS